MHLQSSTVLIRELRIFAHHGVLPQERIVGACFILNLSIDIDFSRAMQSDSLDGTISYAEVCEVVKEQMATPSALLEHVAGRICHAIFDRFPSATTIRLELLKQNPPMSADCSGAGVYVEMTR